MKREFSPLSFAGGIIFGALLAGAWFLGGQSLTMATMTSVNAATSTDSSDTSSGAISISNQPAGDSVLIDSVTVPPPGVWIAVRENSAGVLGNVLGAALVGGPRTSITVPLLRATDPGQTYAVELYRDNGDGIFDLSSDSVYVDFDTGERVVAYFITTN